LKGKELEDLIGYIGMGVTLLLCGFIFIQFMGFTHTASRTIQSSGQISSGLPELLIYENQNYTSEISFIDWEIVYPDDTVNRTIYLENTGLLDISLSMRTENWQPANASNLIMCSWNMEEVNISPAERLPAILSLYIFQNISGIDQFSFDIIIGG